MMAHTQLTRKPIWRVYLFSKDWTLRCLTNKFKNTSISKKLEFLPFTKSFFLFSGKIINFGSFTESKKVPKLTFKTTIAALKCRKITAKMAVKWCYNGGKKAKRVDCWKWLCNGSETFTEVALKQLKMAPKRLFNSSKILFGCVWNVFWIGPKGPKWLQNGTRVEEKD